MRSFLFQVFLSYFTFNTHVKSACLSPFRPMSDQNRPISLALRKQVPLLVTQKSLWGIGVHYMYMYFPQCQSIFDNVPSRFKFFRKQTFEWIFLIICRRTMCIFLDNAVLCAKVNYIFSFEWSSKTLIIHHQWKQSTNIFNGTLTHYTVRPMH